MTTLSVYGALIIDGVAVIVAPGSVGASAEMKIVAENPDCTVARTSIRAVLDPVGEFSASASIEKSCAAACRSGRPSRIKQRQPPAGA